MDHLNPLENKEYKTTILTATLPIKDMSVIQAPNTTIQNIMISVKKKLSSYQAENKGVKSNSTG